jgi:hypothetical protein
MPILAGRFVQWKEVCCLEGSLPLVGGPALQLQFLRTMKGFYQRE